MKRKIVNKDFTYESLPRNRRTQVFQIIKDNFPLLMKIGGFCLLFLLPLLIVFFLKESYLRGIAVDSSLTEENKQVMSLTIEMIFNAAYILCIAISFIGLSGTLKVVRRLIWNEPIFFKEDFILGIKDNFLPSFLTGLVVGIIYYLCFLIYCFAGKDVHYVSYIIAGISFAIIVPILIQSLYLNSLYQNKFKVSFITSSRLFLRRGFLFILPLFAIYALYFVSIIPLGTIYLCFIYVVMFVVLLPIFLLMSYIIEFKILDDYINTYHYPDKAYLGLYISEEKRKEIEENYHKAHPENAL